MARGGYQRGAAAVAVAALSAARAAPWPIEPPATPGGDDQIIGQTGVKINPAALGPGRRRRRGRT